LPRFDKGRDRATLELVRAFYKMPEGRVGKRIVEMTKAVGGPPKPFDANKSLCQFFLSGSLRLGQIVGIPTNFSGSLKRVRNVLR
jgi:hypothetical protein